MSVPVQKNHTPLEEGFFMRPEWAPHERCWMAWPGVGEKEAWYGRLHEARCAYAKVAQSIRHFEPVTMLCNAEDITEAAEMCGPEIQILRFSFQESWSRDIGPSFLSNQYAKCAGVYWQFNTWGEDPTPCSETGRKILDYLHIPSYAAPFILEGGAFCVDGQGTLLTTEECLLHKNRNPSLSRQQIETLLCHYTGCTNIVWLGQGYEQDDTDGHSDAVACFVRPGVVLALDTDDPYDGNYFRLKDNLKRLQHAKTAYNTRLEVIPILQPPPKYHHNTRLTCSYINYYVANGGVIMPIFDEYTDTNAFEIIKSLYPYHKIIPTPVLDIVYGGGGIHCITLHQPVP